MYIVCSSVFQLSKVNFYSPTDLSFTTHNTECWKMPILLYIQCTILPNCHVTTT